LREQEPSKVKLGHKTSQKFKGPYLIVKANPDFFTYKLQNCTNNKVHPSLIHANRLRLCDTERDGFYSKIAVQSDVKTNMDGNTISKTATDSSMEASHKEADVTKALPLPLQTADNTAAATTMPAAPKQSADAARKQRRKQRIFYRSKANGTSQTAATAQCATNDTQVLTRDKQTSRPTVCRRTVVPTGEQTVSSQPQDGLLSSSTQDEGWFSIKRILNLQKRGSRMFYKVEWSTGETSWVAQKDVSDFAKDMYWLEKREKARLRKNKRQQRLKQ